jgi:hypothetical protein
LEFQNKAPREEGRHGLRFALLSAAEIHKDVALADRKGFTLDALMSAADCRKRSQAFQRANTKRLDVGNTQRRVKVVQKEQGTHFNPMGATMIYKATHEDTAGHTRLR